MLKAKWVEKSSPNAHLKNPTNSTRAQINLDKLKSPLLCFLNCETANLHFLLQMQNLISKFVPRALQIRCHMPDPKSNKMSFCLSVATFKKAPGIRFQDAFVVIIIFVHPSGSMRCLCFLWRWLNWLWNVSKYLLSRSSFWYILYDEK